MKLNGILIAQVSLCAAVFFLSHCKSGNSTGSESSSEKAITGGIGPSIKDGCYALAVPGSSSGVVCFGGLSEEGIGGAGVQVAYGTQTSNTEWCAKSTSAGFKDQQFVVSFSPATQMISMSFKGTSDKGTIIIKETDPAGGGTMSYYYMASLKASDMLSSKVCKDSSVSSGGGASAGSNTCKTYIESCPGGRKPVSCSDSFYCIDEVPGANYPRCVPKTKLIDRGQTCGTSSNCMKCP